MSTDASLEDLAAQEGAADPAENAEIPPEAVGDGESQEEGAGSTEDPQGQGEETSSDDDGRLLQRIDNLTGYRLSDRYTSSDEAIRGLGEALRLLGQRDEDAKFGRSLRDKYGDRAEQLLAETGQSGQAAGAPAQELPDSYEAYKAIRDAAQLRAKDPGYESDATYQRGLRASEAVAQQTFEAIRGFQALKDDVSELRNQLKAQQDFYQASNTEQQESAWWQAHQAEMCAQGDWNSLTPLAKRVLNLAQTDEDCKALAGARGPGAALEVARAKALSTQRKPKPTKQVSPNAVHQPGVAPSEHRAMTVEEVLASDLDGEALLKALVEAENNQAG